MRRVELLDDEKPWERARREGWEGVIAKRRGSPYEHRRSKHWLKMKCEARRSSSWAALPIRRARASVLAPARRLLRRLQRLRLCRQDRHRLRHQAPAGSAAAPRCHRAAGVAVYEGHRACRGFARIGCVRKLSCRSRSSSGRCTASCGIRGCSASASTSTRATSRESSRDHASREGALPR